MIKTCPNCSATFEAHGRTIHCEDCRDTGAPWRSDETNIPIAAKHLGINVPVVVRRSATRKLLGRYHGIKLTPDAVRDEALVKTMSDEALNASMYHFITVSARLTPEAASRVVWHEMTHVAQYERDPQSYVDGYAKELREAKRIAARTGIPFDRLYRMISFEVEAKANEDNHYAICPLTLTNRRANMPTLKKPHSRIARVVNGRVVGGSHAEEFETRAKKNIAAARRMQR